MMRTVLASDVAGPSAGADAGKVLVARIHDALRAAVAEAVGTEAPPRLRDAIERAVFGGGARLRPSLCLAVAAAHGDPHPRAAERAAAAIEFVHCASLVHDDLPCFDDAALRRGLPTIHVAFGVPTAVLVGDALIVAAFGTLARAGHAGGNAAQLVATLAEATGAARGIVAGQAWENEPALSLDEYHRAKTASLFMASAALGAQVCGADPRPWRALADALGRAYQATDDVLDVLAEPGATGKTTGRDASLGRPSVVRAYGVEASMQRIARLVDEAAAELPACPDDRPVRAWLAAFAARASGALASI
jgi:geranylgeranyl diphosphate synthase type II